MAKSTKRVEDFLWCPNRAFSMMRWESGEDVNVYLYWDENKFYIRFDPTDSFAEYCAEIGRSDLLIGLENELAQIGIQGFCDLESVNEFCRRYCGSDDPYDRAEFYEDDLGNICGT